MKETGDTGGGGGGGGDATDLGGFGVPLKTSETLGIGKYSGYQSRSLSLYSGYLSGFRLEYTKCSLL